MALLIDPLACEGTGSLSMLFFGLRLHAPRSSNGLDREWQAERRKIRAENEKDHGGSRRPLPWPTSAAASQQPSHLGISGQTRVSLLCFFFLVACLLALPSVLLARLVVRTSLHGVNVSEDKKVRTLVSDPCLQHFFVSLKTSMPGNLPVCNIPRGYYEATTVSRVLNLDPQWT